jgi:hypothetical protein
MKKIDDSIPWRKHVSQGLQVTENPVRSGRRARPQQARCGKIAPEVSQDSRWPLLQPRLQVRGERKVRTP